MGGMTGPGENESVGLHSRSYDTSYGSKGIVNNKIVSFNGKLVFYALIRTSE
jgi:hypothetical protein